MALKKGIDLYSSNRKGKNFERKSINKPQMLKRLVVLRTAFLKKLSNKEKILSPAILDKIFKDTVKKIDNKKLLQMVGQIEHTRVFYKASYDWVKREIMIKINDPEYKVITNVLILLRKDGKSDVKVSYKKHSYVFKDFKINEARKCGDTVNFFIKKVGSTYNLDRAKMESLFKRKSVLKLFIKVYLANEDRFNFSYFDDIYKLLSNSKFSESKINRTTKVIEFIVKHVPSLAIFNCGDLIKIIKNLSKFSDANLNLLKNLVQNKRVFYEIGNGYAVRDTLYLFEAIKNKKRRQRLNLWADALGPMRVRWIPLIDRIFSNKEVGEYLRRVDFREFARKVCKKFKIKGGPSMSILSLITLFKNLPSRLGKTDTSIIFSSRFNDFYNNVGNKFGISYRRFNGLKKNFVDLFTFYRLYKNYDSVKIQEVKKILQMQKQGANPVYETELLMAVSKSLKLMRLVKNRRLLIGELKKHFAIPQHKDPINRKKKKHAGSERPKLGKLRTLLLLKMHLLINAFNNPSFKKKIGKLLKEDLMDKTSEKGFYLYWDFRAQRLILQKLISFTYSFHKKANGRFLGRRTFVGKGISESHFHASRLNSRKFSGPSGFAGDLACREQTIVTSCGVKTINGKKHYIVNVDTFNRFRLRPTVMDLGTFYIPVP